MLESESTVEKIKMDTLMFRKKEANKRHVELNTVTDNMN